MREKGNTGDDTYAVDLEQKAINVCNNIDGEELQNIFRSVEFSYVLEFGDEKKHSENVLLIADFELYF